MKEKKKRRAGEEGGGGLMYARIEPRSSFIHVHEKRILLLEVYLTFLFCTIQNFNLLVQYQPDRVCIARNYIFSPTLVFFFFLIRRRINPKKRLFSQTFPRNSKLHAARGLKAMYPKTRIAASCQQTATK